MSKKILIVEDEEVLLDVYKIKFSQTDYQIITAMDGLAGLELARKELPDLILLDLILPKMDGYQVINELKKDKKTKKIKIYILSNLVQNKEIEKGFQNGVDGFLIKANLTPTQLLNKVNQIFTEEEKIKK
ncbi:MAG: response regulator [Patescibacteria group bacterium]|nr:response regulator [Patescibacteria group bacterium]MBU0879567.1 response regulator [Patescibacteria group bacterium]MBU0880509.1 response regulator [Patescibacteria group bacterium]MBU0898162.1 response regulator [Patescibacteria group bacterium]MBU1062630.1 response regulator [Patescibacteria group bacterium]